MAGDTGDTGSDEIVFEDDVIDRHVGDRRAPKRLSRRSVVIGGVGVVGLTVVGGVVVARNQDAMAPPLDDLASSQPDVTQASSQPDDVTLPVGEFDEVDGISAFTTPLDEQFLIDTASEKPRVDPETYTLSIGGPYVRNPLTLTYDDLLNREHVTRQAALVCISNPVGGDLVSNIVWTGIPLSSLLDEAGIDGPMNPDRQIFPRGADGYPGGFRAPLAYDGRTAMVALFQNGEPLDRNHGFPARLVVAGDYAQTSAIKWLESIEVNDFYEVDSFWVPRGWAKEAPVKISSRIDTMSNVDPVAGTHTIGGVAWAPPLGIDRVEVSIARADVVRAAESFDNATWQDAEVGATDSDETWVQWAFDWEATPGEWVIRVRATDKSGFTQPADPVAPAPDGSEGHHTTFVRVLA